MNQNARTIATHAVQLSGSERDAYIEQQCGSDEALLRTVQRLLDLQESATVESAREYAAAPSPAWNAGNTPRKGMPTKGDLIGEYQLIRELGSGAMGVVYLAEQQTPRREVALKLIRAERLTPDRERRFDFEADALARLRHPGIATIYAAGRADDQGSPRAFIAMERIDGTRLDVHGREIGRDERVRLMAEVCDAIEHAHRRGIVHRDLKPSNVLVERDGRARVVDFGVSCTDDPSRRGAEFVGTLPYMSPEQLRCDPDIDGRTDVFALGVMLYEILCDALPRKVSGETTEELVTAASAPVRMMRQSMPPDLAAIVARAIDPDRDQRYETPGALRDELQRWLRSEPVSAHRGGVIYRARKFSRRHAAAVSLTSLAAMLLIAGVIGVSWQATRATRGWKQAETERNISDAARRRAQSINAFMIDMLTSADPESSRGLDLTVREVLDASAALIETGLDGSASTEAGVRLALSQTYLSLGAVDTALEHASAMVALTDGATGELGTLYSDAIRQKAVVLVEMGRLDEAESLSREARSLVDASGDPIESARVRSELARITYEQGNHTVALEMWEKAEAVMRRELGTLHKDTLICMHNRGSALKDLGRLTESEALLREVLDLRLDLFGSDHPQTLFSRNGLAGVIQKQGRDEEAIIMLREVVAARTRMLGDDHFSTLVSMGNLGAALISHGDLEEAEPLTRKALDGMRRKFGQSHARTLILMGNLAYVLEDLGRLDEAAALYRETIEIRREATGGRDPETWAPMNNLAMLLQRTGKPDEARELYEELLEMCDALLPEGHYYTAMFRNNYGACLTDLGEFDAAEQALQSSHNILVNTLGADHARVQRSTDRMETLDRVRQGG